MHSTSLKILIFASLLFTSILLGCSSGQDKGKFNPNSLAKQDSAQDSSKRSSEVDSLLAMIEQGKYISTPIAESCLESLPVESEKLQCCILGWASGNNSSEKIERFLENQTTTYPAFVFSFLKSDQLIRRLSLDRLLSKISQLKFYPSWVETFLISRWVDLHGPMSEQELNSILGKLLAREDQTRFDVRKKTEFLKKYVPNLFPQYIDSYCDVNAQGDIRMRCWRFLAISAQAGLGQNSSWMTFLPNTESGSDWQLFSLSFPFESSLTLTYSK